VHFWLLQWPPRPQSESNPHFPSGAFAHLPLLHLPPPQSESKPQLEPALSAHFPLLHFTPP